MLQCEICAETLVETLLGEERAEPNQKENNESGNQATDHACCIHPVSRPPIVLLLATPYVCRFLLELRHTIARPLCLARDGRHINPAPPFSRQPYAQLVCTLCITLSMRNANHPPTPSHWCTSVKAALKLAKRPIPVPRNFPNPAGHDCLGLTNVNSR